ncbi:hypothetical protein A9K55_001090 [Cordyceps militaris]|uniref:Uncharacterized protein n=1 Tax=Cordyceps militaris TaxID=73501 RepID=A0A2H4STE3_CORMI|nr:hypothetical protein A9K55_001090 [Cordyceps militaris]
MARTRRHVLLAIVTLLHAAAAVVSPADVPARLRDDAAAFVPACAAPCLASFLAVNYARGDASDQFLDLDFVCAYRGRSGYTVSEGAVQCIAGERNVGFCTKAESGDDALLKATTVCDGAKDAAEPRGGVITATLRYGPTSGILTFAPITTSESAIPVPTSPKSSSTSTSTSTTLTTATPTTSKTTSQTTTITTTTTGTSIATTSATPSPTANVAADQQSLSKGQIAGISVGAVCIAGGLVLAVVLLTRCLLRRRRRQRHRNSSSSSFGPNGPGPTGGSYHTPTRDTWGYRFDKSSHSNSPAPADLLRYPAMSGAAAAAADHPAKELYNRASWRPSAIGLAISPSKLFRSSPTNTPTRTRPLSKLLPAKPDMQQSPPRPTYQESHGDQVPQQQQQQYPIAAQFMRTVAPSLRVVIPDTKLSLLPAVAAAGRDSTLTEFEEDDLRRSTSSTAAGQIWCPPLSASAAPESAVAAYYVADGRGNWILGGGTDPRSPLSAGSAPRIATATAGIVTTAVQTHIPAPRKSPSHNTAAPASPQELAATPLPEAKTTRTGDSQRPASPPRMASITRTPKTVPSPLFSRLSNPRSVSQPVPSHNQPAGRSLTARPAQPRVTSTDSGITTFSISTAVSESPVAQQSSVPTGRARTLSPVAESPHHRTPPPPLPTAVSTDSSSSSPGRSSKVFTDPPPGTSESSGGGGGGVSPVSYPRIHSRDRVLTPGVAPSRTASHAETTHRGPSPAAVSRQPTYGGPDPRGGRGGGRGGMPSPAMQRLRPTAHIAHAARTGSPTMRIVEPSPEPPHPTAASPSPRDDRTLLPSSSVVGAPSRPPRRRPPSNLPHPFPLYPVPRAHRRSAARAEPTQPIDDDGFSRYPMPMPRPYRPQDREGRAPQHVAYDPAAHDNSSQEALATSPSSLLTKRLGSTRAADMALAPKELQRRDHWKQQEEQQQKKKQGGMGRRRSRGSWGEDLVLNVG